MSKYTFVREVQPKPPFNDTIYALERCPCCGDNTLGFDTRTHQIAHIVPQVGNVEQRVATGNVVVNFFCHTCHEKPRLVISDRHADVSFEVAMQWHRREP